MTGKQVADATTLLESDGFQVDSQEDPNANGDAGTVTRVVPAEGSTVAAGSKITIYYSSGLIEVPGVEGESADVAEAQLKDAGFRVRRTFTTTSDEDEGTVLRQVPGEGQRREPNSTVTIEIARAPEEQKPPPPPPDPTPTQSDTPTPDPDPTPSDTPTNDPSPPDPTPTTTEPNLPGVGQQPPGTENPVQSAPPSDTGGANPAGVAPGGGNTANGAVVPGVPNP